MRHVADGQHRDRASRKSGFRTASSNSSAPPATMIGAKLGDGSWMSCSPPVTVAKVIGVPVPLSAVIVVDDALAQVAGRQRQLALAVFSLHEQHQTRVARRARLCTTGISAKLYSGGGEVVIHSSVVAFPRIALRQLAAAACCE